MMPHAHPSPTKYKTRIKKPYAAHNRRMARTGRAQPPGGAVQGRVLAFAAVLAGVAGSLGLAEGATVKFLDSRFTFTSNATGLYVAFDCPSDKWCGMIVSGSREPDVFEHGDTYILARHSLCDCTCCAGLKDNPTSTKAHTCPTPQCCDAVDKPVGLRTFPSVMGEGWSWETDRGIGGPKGLRGDASCEPALDSKYPDRFKYSVIKNWRHYANLSLPWGKAAPGYNTLDAGTLRAVSFSQASVGAAKFAYDPAGSVDSLTVGYHGAGAFMTCLLSGSSICSCGWPAAKAAKDCVNLNDGGTAIKISAAPVRRGHSAVGLVAGTAALVASGWWWAR